MARGDFERKEGLRGFILLGWSEGYLYSRLHQDSVLVQYLLSIRCVGDLEHGDPLD
jgi:hypothetical protein